MKNTLSTLASGTGARLRGFRVGLVVIMCVCNLFEKRMGERGGINSSAWCCPFLLGVILGLSEQRTQNSEKGYDFIMVLLASLLVFLLFLGEVTFCRRSVLGKVKCAAGSWTLWASLVDGSSPC